MAAVAKLNTSELVSEAFFKAKELDDTSPDVSRLLRAMAIRLDVRQAIVSSSPEARVQRFEPDYMMHMNHEMAFMRKSDHGQYVKHEELAILLEQNVHMKMVQTTISLALDLPGEKAFASEVIDRVLNGAASGMEGYPCARQPMTSQLDS